MKISDLAKAAHTQTETIRFYERKGLLPEAARTGANYRLYDASHVQRLAFIRHCRSLDMTLVEIAALLRFKDAPDDHCAEVNALLDAHVGHVAQRIKELKALEKELHALRLQCASNQPAANCGILSGLDAAARRGRSAVPEAPGHVPGTHGLNEGSGS
jgi:Cd(II)/Pb(II)-responsive transcriptional regulator